MGWKHYQTVDHPKMRAPGLKGTVWYPSTNSSLQISIFQIHQIFNISYFPQFNLSFEKKCLFPKMTKNHPKIYTKPPNGCYGYKHRGLEQVETRQRYWQKGRVKRRQNSLHVYPGLMRRLGQGSRVLMLAVDIGDPEQLQIESHF